MLKLLKNKIATNNNYEEGDLITFLNPYSYLIARNNENVFSQIDLIFVDGIVLVKLLNLFGFARVRRNSFDHTSIGRKVLQYLDRTNKSVYIIGTTENNLSKAIKNIKQAYPNINLIGFRNGYFKEGEKEEVIKKIASLNPDYVIVGMGTPKQEAFLVDLRKSGWKGTGFTCGGFLHQAAENVQYYPKLIDKLDFRWLYRIYKEPKLIWRYFILYPKAILFFLLDFLESKVKT